MEIFTVGFKLESAERSVKMPKPRKNQTQSDLELFQQLENFQCNRGRCRKLSISRISWQLPKGFFCLFVQNYIITVHSSSGNDVLIICTQFLCAHNKTVIFARIFFSEIILNLCCKNQNQCYAWFEWLFACLILQWNLDLHLLSHRRKEIQNRN